MLTPRITPNEFMNILVDGGITSDLYEEDNKLLEIIDQDLEGYLQEIDEIFTDYEKSSLFFNLGFLYSVNSSSDAAKNEFYELIDEFGTNELITKRNSNEFVKGFDKHRSEFYTDLESISDKTELAAAYIERAIVTRYLTDSINSLSTNY